MSDEALLAHIRAIHAEVKGEYGWPKMWKELVARGHRVGKERVRRLMQLHGIRARCKRKFVVTTDSKHHLPIAPDLVQRNFTPTAPNQIWTGDITYIATDEGWLYLAAVIDLFSRQVVGWSMQPHMQSSLVTDALKMAWFRRHPAPGLIFHSDRGSQYCGHEFQEHARGVQDEELNEPQGQLLGQRTDGEPVGPIESGQAIRAKVCHSQSRQWTK